MLELMVSIPAALLLFKDLKAVSNSSVVKSELLMELVEIGRIFLARERPIFFLLYFAGYFFHY